MGAYVRSGPCEACGSSGAKGYYEDGTAYCHKCETYFGSHTNSEKTLNENRSKSMVRFLQGSYSDLPKRGIREDVCRKYGYQIGATESGEPCHIANHRDATGAIVAQKIRGANKHFSWLGERSLCLPLWGQHLWSPGRSIVITEGEIDALSVSTAFEGKNYPVVSLPDGAPAAPKAIKAAYEWLVKFEKIVLCFDNDEVGQKATQQVAEMLPVGKVYVMRLPHKDANETLVTLGPAPIVKAFWDAVEWRPDGIVNGCDLWQTILTTKDVESVSYPWPVVNDKTRGLRRGELITVTAGSGIGKSLFVREIAKHLIDVGETVGMLMLEESTTRTALGMMSIALNKPLHINKDDTSEEELRAAFTSTLGSGRLFLYDHFGSTEIDNLLNKVRYMAKALGCRWVIIDHLSIVVSALEGNDERKLIDKAMTLLRTLVQETGIGLLLVSHLRRPDGKGDEEGAQTSLSRLRGSHAIAQLSDMVIGLERNQQGDSPDKTTVRVLKNRFSGDTGENGILIYNKITGRLNESNI